LYQIVTKGQLAAVAIGTRRCSLLAFFIMLPFTILMEIVFIRREKHIMDVVCGREFFA